MANTKLYTIIYVVLFVMATVQVLIERAGFLEEIYWIAFGVIMVLSLVKAVVVAGWYQHLKYEPRSISYLILIALFGAVVLTLAASYSIL